MNLAVAGFFNILGWLSFGTWAATGHSNWQFAMAALTAFFFAFFALFDRRVQ